MIFYYNHRYIKNNFTKSKHMAAVASKYINASIVT